MNIKKIILENFTEHQEIYEATLLANFDDIEKISKVLSASLLNSGTIFWCGNGGSASDSQHLAAELLGRFKKNRRPLRSMSLNADTSVLTCISNDFNYKDIFARQIEALGRPGDVLVGISTSGNSDNVFSSIIKAKEIGLTTVGLLGKGGGKMKSVLDLPLIISSETTARIQEMHIFIGHILCDLIEAELGFER